MQSPETFIDTLPDERKDAMTKLRKTILDNLPAGFEEQVGAMINYVVPFSLYPDGYHCPPKQPLPFMSIASQKNFIALYHMGVYADKEILDWFVSEYPNYSKYKLDMGKSCIRFKRIDDIPYELLGRLVTKISVDKWVSAYENAFKKK